MAKRRTKTSEELQEERKKFKNKPVTFNKEDPDEAALLDWAEKRTNFSRYVKMLISKDRDIQLLGASSVRVSADYLAVEEPQNTITKDDAEGFI